MNFVALPIVAPIKEPSEIKIYEATICESLDPFFSKITNSPISCGIRSIITTNVVAAPNTLPN